MATSGVKEGAGLGLTIREGVRLMFRAELFNALNSVDYSGPTTSITSSTFGKITLSQSNTPRQVQFSLRLKL